MRTYKKPILNVEHFVPNEFVASACGDSGTIYNFVCNAGSKGKHYDIYETGVKGETTGGTNLTEDPDWWTTSYYYPCDETHKASSDSEFVYGYIVDNGGRDNTDGPRTPVYIWKEVKWQWIWKKTYLHCTTNLDMTTWETAKS